MGLNEAKSQVKYLSENDVNFIWEQSKEESREEMAINAIKEGLSFDLIKKLTGLGIEKIKELKTSYESGKQE